MQCYFSISFLIMNVVFDFKLIASKNDCVFYIVKPKIVIKFSSFPFTPKQLHGEIFPELTLDSHLKKRPIQFHQY